MVPKLFRLHPVSVTKRKQKAAGMQKPSQALSQHAAEGQAPGSGLSRSQAASINSETHMFSLSVCVLLFMCVPVLRPRCFKS